MNKLILWIINQLHMGYSNEIIIAKLETMEAITRALSPYSAEDTISKIIDKMQEVYDNAE